MLNRPPSATIFAFALAFALVISSGAPGTVHAQPQEHVDFEVPVIVEPPESPEIEEVGADINLANLVLFAARAKTTVQEAPAIVTVITANDIRARGYQNLRDIIDTVPGWQRGEGVYGQFPFLVPRGTIQAVLYMHNGLSLFDPFGNVPQFGRVAPLETIKRVEVVTGPGGVLWGANSYTGIINVITKTAEDVDGIEGEITGGDGVGDRRMFRGFVMAGFPRLLSGNASLFMHASFETYKGPAFRMPQVLFATALPYPRAPVVYGPVVEADPARSMIFVFDGNLTVGDFKVSWLAPFVERHLPLGFNATVTQTNLPEDVLAECSRVSPTILDGPLAGQRNPEAFLPSDRCYDRARIGRDNRADWLDRYITAEYPVQFAGGKATATIKGYAVQFVRNFNHAAILAPSNLLEGGLSFRFDATSYRAGGMYDGNVTVTPELQLLHGFEMFHEWVPNRVTSARQGEGAESFIVGPSDLTKLPLPCPRMPHPDQLNNPGQTLFVPDCPLTFLFKTNRTVLGTYVNPRWRATKRLILDAGARFQVAPGKLSHASYDPQILFSGAAVYRLASNYHLKLNYAEGFRPPVFNNTDSNGESIQIDGRRDLKTETSKAIQVELNGRLFKGVRAVRELIFRADYAYTRLDNLIQIVGGRYENVGTRGMHSAEFLAKIYLKGGHQLELSYSWLRIYMDDLGVNKTYPEHWFRLGGVINVFPKRLQATATFRVSASADDPNSLVEYRDLQPGDQLTVNASEIVLDRIPPVGQLDVGLTYLGLDKLRLRVVVYDVFNAGSYYADAFHDYNVRLEPLPNPRPAFRFVLSATYMY